MTELTEDQITAVVYAAIDDLNKQLPKAKRLEKSGATAIVGDGARLDSLGIVNFLFNTEKHAKQTLGLSLALTDAAASADDADLRNVDSYCKFIMRLAKQQSHE